jgi:hypothetical protein
MFPSMPHFHRMMPHFHLLSRSVLLLLLALCRE